MRPPRNLFSRFAWTLISAVLMFQIAIMSALGWLVMRPLLQASAGDLAGLIEVSTKTWVELPAERRQALVDELATRHRLWLAPGRAVRGGETSWLPYIWVLQEELSRRIGVPVSVSVQEGQETWYWLQLPSDAGPLAFGFPQSRIGTQPQSALAAVFGLSLVGSFIAAYLLARRLTRPLRELEAAAEQVGRGEAAEVPMPNDAAELDSLVAAFNAMAREVRGLLQNRATLLAGVSHDLRSPIARLRMALELSRDRIDPASFEAMERYLEDLSRLIDIYLDYSRGVLARHEETTDLHRLLAALAHDQPGEISFEGDDIECMIDRVGLARIVTNLLENASRYGQGRPIELRLKREDGWVVVTVADRGPGIPTADLDRVFQPFVRLEHSRNPKTGGAGLGLAIVQDIAKANGWKVSLEPRPGGGTIASLTLTLGGRADPIAVASSPSSSAATVLSS